MDIYNPLPATLPATTFTGLVTIGGGGNSTPQLTFTPNSGNAVSLGMANAGSELIVFSSTAQQLFGFSGVLFVARSDGVLAFCNTTIVTGTLDSAISRVSAGVLGIGTGAQGSVAGTLHATVLRTIASTVAGLPAAATASAGARAMVTDATATLTAGIGAVVAGTGANIVPVVSDGTNWRIG